MSTAYDCSVDRLDQKYIASDAHVLGDAFATYRITRYMLEGLDDAPEWFRVMFGYLIQARIVRK